MVLPEPGGPIIIILCPPAAATSKARFTCSCPFTSIKSRTLPCSSLNISFISTWYGSITSLLLRKLIASNNELTGKTLSSSPAIAASFAFCSGRITPFIPCLFASTAMDNAPWTGRSVPSSASSPSRIWSTNFSSLTSHWAVKIPIAIGRS